MRIGLFGGTFNPIHRGHLWAALEVKKKIKLDQIILVPAALPPHKTPGLVARADDRLEMIRLAIDGLAGIKVSDVELHRAGPSYTIDTIRHFKHTLPKEARTYLIMGLDAFLEIHTWKSHRKLLEQIAFIVMARPAEHYTDARQGWKILEAYLKSALSADYQWSQAQDCYRCEGKQPVRICDIKALDVSSTEVRENVKKKKTIDHLVTPRVADYIRLKGLYQ